MASTNKRLLRLKNVLDKTGDSRSGLYLKISQGTFPKPIKLSTRQSAWIEEEINEWIIERIEATRGQIRSDDE